MLLETENTEQGRWFSGEGTCTSVRVWKCNVHCFVKLSVLFEFQEKMALGSGSRIDPVISDPSMSVLKYSLRLLSHIL